jgi:hypothetical protein
MERTRIGQCCRYALGGIRLVNGAVALATPQTMARRLGSQDGAALYALRLFGVRTVILGAELLVLRGDRLDAALRTAPVIHASDTVSALAAGLRGHLPVRVATLTTVISATNTALALIANKYPVDHTSPRMSRYEGVDSGNRWTRHRSHR